MTRASKLLLPTLALLVASAVGGAALAQKAQKAAAGGGSVLPGGDSGKPINITAAKLDYFDKEQKLIYTGDVIAIQGESTLKSSVLTIFLNPKKADAPGQTAPQGGTNGRVRHMIAKGPVTLVQRDQIGTGDNGVYDKPSNTVVLTGHVVLTQGANVSKGDKLVYDLKSGQAVVSGGRVSSMFIPDDAGSQPAAAPAPATAPAPKRRAKSARRSE